MCLCGTWSPWLSSEPNFDSCNNLDLISGGEVKAEGEEKDAAALAPGRVGEFGPDIEQVEGFSQRLGCGERDYEREGVEVTPVSGSETGEGAGRCGSESRFEGSEIGCDLAGFAGCCFGKIDMAVEQGDPGPAGVTIASIAHQVVVAAEGVVVGAPDEVWIVEVVPSLEEEPIPDI